MSLNLYNILNIPEHIIIENNIHDILQTETLENLNQAVSILNKFHSYFHFEQSFAYLLAAYIVHLKEDAHSTQEYLTKAIFQDHLNEQALNFYNNASLAYIFFYNKNIRYEKDFLTFAIGKFVLPKEVELLDNAIELSISSKIVDTEINYKSHRLDCMKTIIAIYNKELDLANIYVQNAINSIENSHKNYHQFASMVYLKRAEIFELEGQIDLAKNDRLKAKDLFS
jgi:hypothetical protein